jgi:hypothetical protein
MHQHHTITINKLTTDMCNAKCHILLLRSLNVRIAPSKSAVLGHTRPSMLP